GPLSEAQREMLREPQARALGARYALGCWTRELEGERVALDHEGSVAGYQSLLLLLPGERAALAVLTNSWRGSALVRRVVRDLGLVPRAGRRGAGDEGVEPGRYALDGAEAIVEATRHGARITEVERDPVTGTRIARSAVAAEPLGDGVYGLAGGLLMSHRVDFPRPGVARVGWVALPRVGR
ncbi:MAG: hypothetical protein IRZ20_06765, partial [Thermoleophilia bacterium]|nr:hypothetical protein [Thermoleophilia bacterium]